MQQTTIDTRLGRITGNDHGTALAFLGIRYGKAPIGARRFLPPDAAEKWNKTYDATFLHNQAFQDVHFTFFHETQREDMGPIDEDCLFLNVFTPAADGGSRPVMVWIHGGGYVGGSANEYSGTQLSIQGDVVVVAINYRVGAFGFLNLKALGPEYKGSANNGIRDMILALDWIRDNMCPDLPPLGKSVPDGARAEWNEARLIIFTEYDDTKRYLVEQLNAAIAGTTQAHRRIAVYHGPTPPPKREELKRAFNKDPRKEPLRILVATDAAREGLNLQS